MTGPITSLVADSSLVTGLCVVAGLCVVTVLCVVTGPLTSLVANSCLVTGLCVLTGLCVVTGVTLEGGARVAAQGLSERRSSGARFPHGPVSETRPSQESDQSLDSERESLI